MVKQYFSYVYTATMHIIFIVDFLFPYADILSAPEEKSSAAGGTPAAVGPLPVPGRSSTGSRLVGPGRPFINNVPPPSSSTGDETTAGRRRTPDRGEERTNVRKAAAQRRKLAAAARNATRNAAAAAAGPRRFWPTTSSVGTPPRGGSSSSVGLPEVGTVYSGLTSRQSIPEVVVAATPTGSSADKKTEDDASNDGESGNGNGDDPDSDSNDE